MSEQPENWLELQEQLLSGDRVAFARMNRLISGFLIRLRAYDFREEWDDLRQEVLVSVIALRSPLKAGKPACRSPGKKPRRTTPIGT